MSQRIAACLVLSLLWSCSKNNSLDDADMSAFISQSSDDTAAKEPAEITVHKISKSKAPAKSDSFSISKVIINKDQLLIEVEYGGGCEDHEFTFYWDGTFLKGNPQSVELMVIHDANNDSCEAQITETLKVDLSSIKKAYNKSSNKKANQLTVVVKTLEGQKKDVKYEF